MTQHQQITKRWFDKHAQFKAFHISDLVLMWDKAHEEKGKHAKFDKLWLGLFQISTLIGHNTFKLRHLMGEDLPLSVNGKHLKHYFQA